jgi:hypothetical protein
MKKVIFTAVLVLFTGTVSFVNAQDVITKKRDGSEIRAKVIEVGPDKVRYRLYKDPNGPVRVLPISEISMIEYENGTEEIFDEPEPETTRNSRPDGYTQDSRAVRQNRSGQIRSGGYTQGQPNRSRQVRNDYDYGYGYDDDSEPVNYRRGYVGLGLGGSFLLEQEDYNLENGVQITVNAGYCFGKHIGITSSFLYTSYNLTNREDTSIGLIGGVIGPLISFPSASQKMEFDIRPTFGFVSLQAQQGDKSETDDESALAVDLGATFRWNVSRVISLAASMDYIRHAEFDSYNVDFSSIGITVGLNIRF